MNVDEMVSQAKAAYRAGRLTEARELLLDAVQQNANHEDAWLWLSGLVETLEDQQICLQNVLALNPLHARARKGLEAVEQKLAAQAADLRAPAVPPVAEPEPDWGTPATSVEWGRGDGPAVYGSGKQVELPSREDYDAWVSELHLGVEQPGAPLPSTPPFVTDSLPFGSTTYMVEPSPFVGDSPLMTERLEPAPDEEWPAVPQAPRAPNRVTDPPPTRVWPEPEPPAAPVRRAVRHEFSFDDEEYAAPPAASPPTFAAQEIPAPIAAPAPVAAPQKPAQPAATGSERYFAYIPAEVTADRAQGRSRALNVALIVVLLANAAAVVALVTAL